MIDREELSEHKTFLKFVMFGLGKERYAAPVLKVKEIIASGRVFPLPKMPPFIEGILSLRGEIIPIVDLRKRFDLPAVEKTDESRIVVLEMTNFFVGISVDQVYEVIKVEEERVEPPPPLVGGLRADFLDGVCEIDSHLITVLNLEQIFSSTERSMLAVAAGAGEEGPPPKGAAAAASPKTSKAAAPAAPAPKAPGPAAPPALALEPAGERTVGTDGRIQYSGRTFYIGTRFAGVPVRVEPTADGVVVREGEEVVKRFRL